MAPRSAPANISFTVDSASEDEMALDTFPTPDSNTENKAPRRGRGRPAKPAETTKTRAAAKAKPAARRASGESVLGVKKESAAVAKKTGTARGRKAAAKTKVENVSETEEVDEFDGEEEVKPVVKRGRPAKAKKAKEEEGVAEVAAPTKRGRKAAESTTETKPAPKAKSSTTTRGSKRVTKAEPKPEAKPALEEPEMTIQETQADPEPEPMDVDESKASIESVEIPESMPPPPRPSTRPPVQPRTARQSSAGARRAGSVSDTERDPALRRKVGDLTKKLDAMTAKYESLREVATSQRESNFEQLKRQTEQVAKNQDAVIKALKQQLSEMQSRSSELSAAKEELSKLQKENSRLESENKTLTTSLDTAQKDVKTLSTKLAAARSTAPTDSKAVPGSAVKAGRSAGVVLPGAVEAAKEAQMKQLKIDLYSDLTNLVVLNWKRGEEGEDVFDCLQTGRNGTLHFQLSVLNDEESYGDAQFVYTPLLDEKRDAELLDLLPDYLTDELEFPRNQVAKFYEKVAGSMSRAVELVD